MTRQEILSEYLRAVDEQDQEKAGQIYLKHSKQLGRIADVEGIALEAIQNGEYATVICLLTEFPELIPLKGSASEILSSAAGYSAIPILQFYFDQGVNLNISNSKEYHNPPLFSAIIRNRLDSVRFLLDHGVPINYPSRPGQPVICQGFGAAVIDSHIEMAKLLIDRGAELNICDNTNQTPLQWAINYNQTELADYIRSKGGIEAKDAPNYRPPEIKSELVQLVEHRFYTEKVRHLPLITEPVQISIRYLDIDGWAGYMTDGMSQLTLPKFESNFDFKHIELVLPDCSNQGISKSKEDAWILEWLQSLAYLPFQQNVFYTEPLTIIANGEPPESLGPNTEMTCWLLLPQKDPFDKIYKLSDKEVIFYTVMPIFTAERDYERKHGALALLKAFEKHDTPCGFVFERECAV